MKQRMLLRCSLPALVSTGPPCVHKSTSRAHDYTLLQGYAQLPAEPSHPIDQGYPASWPHQQQQQQQQQQQAYALQQQQQFHQQADSPMRRPSTAHAPYGSGGSTMQWTGRKTPGWLLFDGKVGWGVGLLGWMWGGWTSPTCREAPSIVGA